SSSSSPAQPARAAEPREPGFIWDGPFPPPARPRAPGRRDRPDPLPPSCGRGRRRPRAHWPRLRVTSGELWDWDKRTFFGFLCGRQTFGGQKGRDGKRLETGSLGGKGGAGVQCSQGIASPSSLSPPPPAASLFKYFIGGGW
uniref:Uncharacterized protein n=1 Tax=Bos indicus x Bos taurus TaxID=30522 RepID=A0A4W2GX12_BOBOX